MQRRTRTENALLFHYLTDGAGFSIKRFGKAYGTVNILSLRNGQDVYPSAFRVSAAFIWSTDDSNEKDSERLLQSANFCGRGPVAVLDEDVPRLSSVNYYRNIL